MKSRVIDRDYKSWFIYCIAIFSSLFIGYKLLSFTDWGQFLSVFGSSTISFKLIIVTLLLPFLTIYLESVKWSYLLAPLVSISQKMSVKSVLMGISTGIFTPGRVGEIAGRIISDNSQKKPYVTSMFVVGSFIQTFITIVLGVVGIILLKLDIFTGKLLISLLVVALLPLVIWILAKGFQRVLPNYFPTDAINSAWLSIRQVTFKKMMVTLVVSLVKYSIYSLQLYIALYLFNPSIELISTLPKIAIFYFGVTFLPGFLWADLGIRGSLSLFLFSTATVQGASVLIPIYLIWLLNSCIPALVGLILLLNHKRLNNK